MHHQIPIFLALRLYVRRFQMPNLPRYTKTLATFGIVYATDPLLQKMTKIVCLLWLTFDIFYYKSLYSIPSYVRQFFKITVVFHTLYLWNEVVDLSFFLLSWHEISRLEHFLANVLNLCSVLTGRQTSHCFLLSPSKSINATSFPGTYLRVFLKFVDINRTTLDWLIRDLLSWLLNQVTALNAFIVVALSLYRLVTLSS